MATGSFIRQRPAAGEPIVAFDFDGTLTVRDSFTSLMRWRAGTVHWALGLTTLAPAAAQYLLRKDRGLIKAAAARTFLSGLTARELSAQAERFADETWDRFMRPDALACWNAWGERGAHRVIVTASPALTVAPFARRLGAEALIGTELAFAPDGRMTGALSGPNCRAHEKVERLHAAYGPDVRLAAAYGDTSGDAEMLGMADEKGYRIFTARA